MIDGMFVIDAHTHPYMPRKVAWGEGFMEYSPEMLIKRMDEVGIDMAVMLPNGPQDTLDDIRKINDWCSKAMNKYSKRLIGFAKIDITHPDFSTKEMERCVNSLGLKGVGEITPVHHLPIDNPVFFPIMEKAEDLDIPLNIHSDYNKYWCSPERFASLAKRFPRVTLIMAHMGFDCDLEHYTPDVVKETPNVILESSATRIPESVFTRPCRVLGKERVALGSDLPTLSIEAQIAMIRVAERYGNVHGWGYAPLTKEEKKHILGLNIAHLLKIDI